MLTSNRGVVVYLTAEEKTALSLLIVGLVVAFLLPGMSAVSSRDIHRQELMNYRQRDWLMIGGYVAAWIMTMMIAGPVVVSFSIFRNLMLLICRLLGY